MSDREIFYGCYNGSHKKFYRWQCKKFDNEPDATKFASSGAEKSDIPVTMLITVSSHVPECFHRWQIEKGIRNMTQVEILHK